MLKETFIKLIANYSEDINLAKELWLEIENQYSCEGRYYHTLTHLENLLQQLNEVKAGIQHWDTVLFTMYYHDIIYDAQKSDNEEKSAELAVERLGKLSLQEEQIALCKEQILATKSHTQSTDRDTNYFTDIDLSILGQDWQSYSLYFKNVRKEYSIYPDLMYNSGRKKVLEHFLGMEKIFKTDFFNKKYELQAKQNLLSELKEMNQ